MLRSVMAAFSLCESGVGGWVRVVFGPIFTPCLCKVGRVGFAIGRHGLY